MISWHMTGPPCLGNDATPSGNGARANETVMQQCSNGSANINQTRGPLGPIDCYNAVADSALARTEKAICYALLRYRNGRSGQCYPSVETLARASSMAVRTVQTTIASLEDRGIVVVVEKSRGGLRRGRTGASNNYFLNVDALPPRNPAPRAGLEDARHAAKPRKALPNTPQHTAPNPAAAAPKPSIHPTSEPTKEPSDGASQLSRARWMDGATRGDSSNSSVLNAMQAAALRRQAVYNALQLAGVRGANADHLADLPDLTVEAVRTENQRLRADPDVDNPPAALVRLLAKRHGVILRGLDRPKRSGLVDSKLLAHSRQLAARRSQQRTLSSGESIGDVASRMFPPPMNP